MCRGRQCGGDSESALWVVLVFMGLLIWTSQILLRCHDINMTVVASRCEGDSRIYHAKFSRSHCLSSDPGRIYSDVVQVLQCIRRSEEHTSELQSRGHLVCRLLLEK